MSSYAAEEGRLVYVSNLPNDVVERDIDNIFGKYGRIRSVAIKKLTRPPPFAFVEFSDRRDASDAVRGRDNYEFYGYRLRVEFAKGNRRNDRDRGGDRGRDDRGGDRYDDRRDDRRDDHRDGGRRERRKERPRREFKARNTAFRVLVKDLPSSASWQDVKDFIKKAVRPIYTDVEKDRDGNPIGVVGFESADDVERCVKKLDDTKFSTGDDGDCYVRVVEDKEHQQQKSRSRSPAAGRGRSPSPRRQVSRSRSRSPVAAAPAARGRGVSRSASPPAAAAAAEDDKDQMAVDADRAGSGSPARSRSPSQEA